MTPNDESRVDWIRQIPPDTLWFWAAFGGSFLYVLVRPTPEPPWRHYLKAIASGAMAYGLHDSLSVLWFFGGNKGLTAVMLMLFGMFLLDGMSAALQRKEFVAELIKIVVDRVAGGGGGQSK